MFFVFFCYTRIAAQDQHCLWELTTEKSQVYFAGSIHVFSRSDYPLDPVFENAYSRSSIVYFEVNMDSMAMPEIQQKVMMAGFLKNQTLKDILSDSTIQRLTGILKQYQIPFASVQSFKPWVISTVLTMASLNNLGIDQESGLDNYFYQKAKSDGKKIHGMETIQDQLDCFNALEGDLGEDMMLETIQSLNEISDIFNQLKDMWNHGNTTMLDSLMNNEMNPFPELKQILLFNRNQRWFQQVKTILNRGEKALIVVGTGHLVGEGSLIDLLQQKGYEVVQR